MKTAVSVPDDLFRAGEAAAHKLRISRSRLYTTALEEFLDRQRAGAITQRLNEVYSKRDARLDPALHRAQLKPVRKDTW